MKRIGKNLLSLVFAAMIVSCAFVPSQDGTSDKQRDSFVEAESYEKIVYHESLIQPYSPYLYGNQFVPNRLTKQQLINEYNEWKAQYVVSAGNGMLRVRRDAGTDYDTVSEGIAYGMLLAAYFSDRDTLDGLYKYAKAHFNSKGLMHWKVDKNGVNISEFNIPVPHGIVWKNTNTGQQIATNEGIIASELPGTGWVRVTWYTRGMTSATDADVDIALALIMANKLWGSSANYNYRTEANTLLSNIMLYDMGVGFSNELFLYPGACVNGTWSGIWGGPKGWNPSYFTPAWFKVFKEFTGDSRWDELSTKIYQHIDKILLYSKNTGLLPDWCNTSSTSVSVVSGTYNAAEDSYSGVSDILVFLVERTNTDGKIVTNYYSTPKGNMSFNVYYDAIRVIWRMALAVSWYGDEKAKNILMLQNQFFRNKYYQTPQGINNIKDGYSIDGTDWHPLRKDALSVSRGGQWTTSPFVAMVSTSALFADDDYARKLYGSLVSSKTPYTDTYHYYGNTLRLLALLYLSGEFPNPLQNISSGDNSFRTLPRIIQAEKFTTAGNVSILNDSSAEEGKVININNSQGWLNFNVEVPVNPRYSFVSYGVSTFVGENFIIECRVKAPNGGKIILDNSGQILGKKVEINVTAGSSWQNINFGSIPIAQGRNRLL
ncbi:MAG: glycosyl hydrolase family 8, partial [Brevinematales bacterium]|nr:glycosyl hydrolase family 8 [Brevinematales bacterium]